MKHVFISYATPDATIADRLAEDLNNAGHDTQVDTHELTLGDDAMEFMNNGIEEAHTVVILFSKHSANARWQKLEIKSALWNEVAQEGGTCIVIRLDDSKLPPMLGSKAFGTLIPTDQNSYQKLLEKLCRAILPSTTASSVISEAFRPESGNPFRHIRAEVFENRPDLHAKTFAPPDAIKVGALEEMLPCFLEGSRGTGKSMLLLSLRARNYISRNTKSSDPFRIFGFYLKLGRGALCNAGSLGDVHSDPQDVIANQTVQITDIASQEIILCLLECLFSEISFCVDRNLLPCDRQAEKTLVDSADLAFFGDSSNRAKSFDELLEKLADTHKHVASFIRRRFIYGEQANVPIATFDLELFKRAIKLVKKSIPSLRDSMFVALLDEYENLFPFQQRIMNGFVKHSLPDISIKIAKKIGSSDTSGTTTGQELQESHDYARITLVYDVQDNIQGKAYHELLKHIVSNILKSEGLKNIDIRNLLPKDSTPEVDDEKLMFEIAQLSKVSVEEFRRWPIEQQKDRTAYYKEAAIYRVLFGAKGRHKDKHFSGFDELALLSSGVIRYFQEILGVAYHLTYGAPCARTDKLIIPPENQSKAVTLVSQHNLTTLSRNVEKDGELLKYFLLDLGDCLRHKLLKHTSEPEAARLTIEDPEQLTSLDMSPLKSLLQVGTREGVFQTKEGLPAFKPKHSSDPQPAEFNICRIYAPVLQISPRLRWRTQVTCKSLLDLTLPEKRAKAKQNLMTEIIKPKRENKQPRLL